MTAIARPLGREARTTKQQPTANGRWLLGVRCVLALIAVLAWPSFGVAADAAAAGARPAGQGVDDVKVTPEVEELINGALKYLAKQQLPSGAWEGAWNSTQHLTAYTAYCLVPFLATGNLPNEGEYGQTVSRGVQFLLDNVRPDGFIAFNTNSNMYGHGISTIVLSEVYGQTKDPKIRPKLERAVKLIVAAQSPKYGGWRYMPRPADADISVTVLQLVALRSAKNSGIEVPQETLDRGVKFVRDCNDKASGGFTYTPRSGGPGFSRTAAAIYSLQVCGFYDDEMVKKGAAYLWDHRQETQQYYSYGSFYAAPAMYMVGGDQWKRWYDSMTTLLTKRALKGDGYVGWTDGAKPYGNIGGANVWATAIFTTVLALPYHYIPLYQR